MLKTWNLNTWHHWECAGCQVTGTCLPLLSGNRQKSVKKCFKLTLSGFLSHMKILGGPPRTPPSHMHPVFSWSRQAGRQACRVRVSLQGPSIGMALDLLWGVLLGEVGDSGLLFLVSVQESRARPAAVPPGSAKTQELQPRTLGSDFLTYSRGHGFL